MEEKAVKEHPEIKGWGIDADEKNDPTYPIKQRTNEEQKGYSWERPTQQPIDIEVLKSIERPNIPAVFGTSAPPRGLSGMIRRVAFRYGEGRFAHWLPLIMADRVDMVEGIFDDLRQGHVPNVFAEKGYNVKWKYDREGVIRKLIVGTAVVGVAAALLFRKRSRS